MQQLGGIWIVQTLPAIVIGLYTNWFHRLALQWGWLVGMVIGTGMVVANDFKSTIFQLHIVGQSLSLYVAIFALIGNLIIAILLTFMFRALGLSRDNDRTTESDYSA